VALMATVAGSGLFIWTIRLWAPFSPIHLLSVLVLVMLWRGVRARRQHCRAPPHHAGHLRFRPDHYRAFDLHPRPHHVCRRLRPAGRDTWEVGGVCRLTRRGILVASGRFLFLAMLHCKKLVALR
jgi:hypothetical protein